MADQGPVPAAAPRDSTEFADEVDRDTGMHASLLVVEDRTWAERKNRLMPDTGVDVDAERTVAVEGDEVLGRHVVAGFGEQRHEACSVARREDLTAVGMIVRFMRVDPAGIRRLAILRGGRGIGEPAGDVTAADCTIDRMLDLTAAAP